MSYCQKHRTQIDNATCEAYVTVDAGTFEGRRISGSATFTPVASDGKFIKWSGPVRVRTGHDILWTLDWDWLGFTVGCECGDRFTGDDENAAREEHAAHVDRVTQHAGQDPVLYHARNPYLPARSKGHNRLDLIEIDGQQPARPRAWWRRLLRWC
ncbi:hypothetical protein [Mycobacteroides abscessus]|uniref:hypothetical protein n=1 Tax=Mycobacteroides abscessus TaxID=36809 RepID=UPI000C269851|nr:hypothetical protein [Mycobacteroides abscessus]